LSGSGSQLEALVRSRRFGVTSEVVPPRSSDPEPVERQARELVGYADAVNVTDNPTASAHMSPVAGAAIVARTGVEPTLQLTVRDRNRLAIAADLLGAWALGARNLLCLTGDPLSVGDEPDAAAVNDIGVLELMSLAARLREESRLPSGAEIVGASLLRRRGRQPSGRALRPDPSRGQAGCRRRVRHDPDRVRP
jgi:5,10-methylenetetrahydrofolate reductase